MTYEHDIFEQYETPKSSVNNKIKNAWKKIKYFPSLLWEYFYFYVFRSVKLWGSGILIIIIYVLWTSWAFYSMYYSVLISHETNKYLHHQELIEFHQKEKYSAENNLHCMRNQMKRISEGKVVEINFCKK